MKIRIFTSLLVALLMLFPQFIIAQSQFEDLGFMFASEKKERKQDPMSIGVRAGMNFSDFSKGDYDIRPCFHFDALMDVPFHTNWSIRPGVSLSMKGGRQSLDRPYMIDANSGYVLSADEKYYFSPLYIDIPVLLTYKIHTDDLSNIFISLGPYVSFGVGGYMKKEFLGKDRKVSLYEKDEMVDNASNSKYPTDLGYKRFNYGVMLEAGYFYEGFHVSVGYDLGLSTVSNSTDAIQYNFNNREIRLQYSQPGMKHRVWKVSIGYFFDL